MGTKPEMLTVAPSRRIARFLPRRHDAVLSGIALIVALLVLVSGSPYWQTFATDGLILMCFAYSWNLVSGYLGYFSFGQVAFYGYGQYATALLITKAHIPTLGAIAIAIVIVSLMAIPIGAILLRLRGIYFALGTLALVPLSTTLAVSLHVLGGDQGLSVPTTTGLRGQYLITLVVTVLVIVVSAIFAHSRLALRAMSIRDDEDAMEAVGVRTGAVKLMCFSLSTAIAAAAGGLAVSAHSFVLPEIAFSSTVNLQGVLYTLVGGSGTLWGPFIGTVILQGILSQLLGLSATVVAVGMGILIMVVMVRWPVGIVGILDRLGIATRRVVFPPRNLSFALRDGGEALLQRREEVSNHEVPATLVVEDVRVAFGGFVVIKQVSLTVNDGEFVLLIGANGAGKTTLFNVITGYVKPTRGSLRLNSQALGSMSTTSRARLGIVRTFQIPRLAESLTVWENILVAALLESHRSEAEERTAWLIASVGLEDVWNQAVSGLGPGYRRRVELARAVAARPKVILLDEVMAGLSSDETLQVREVINNLRPWGVRAIVGVEHVLSAVVDLCDRVVVLDLGSVIAEGSAKDVLSNKEVHAVYLGNAGIDRGARSAVDDEPGSSSGRMLDLAHVRSSDNDNQSSIIRVLKVEDLSGGYGRVPILRNISMEVRSGEIVVILGASGAGKTTLLRSITGICDVHQGRVMLFGEDITGMSPFEVARLGVAHIPSGRELFPDMTVQDNLLVGATLVPVRSRQAAVDRVASLFPEIEALMKRRAHQLSGGEQQIVALGRGLMTSPKVVLLDEPSTGLAPIVLARLMDRIRILADQGVSVLLVEQSAEEALRIASHAYVLKEGAISLSGTPEDLLADRHFDEAYFGAG